LIRTRAGLLVGLQSDLPAAASRRCPLTANSSRRVLAAGTRQPCRYRPRPALLGQALREPGRTTRGDARRMSHRPSGGQQLSLIDPRVGPLSRTFRASR
jgi:hypothetical protein